MFLAVRGKKLQYEELKEQRTKATKTVLSDMLGAYTKLVEVLQLKVKNGLAQKVSPYSDFQTSFSSRLKR